MVNFIISEHFPSNDVETALLREKEMQTHGKEGYTIDANFNIVKVEVGVAKDIFDDTYKMLVHMISPLTSEFNWFERWYTFDIEEAEEVRKDILDTYLCKLESEVSRVRYLMGE